MSAALVTQNLHQLSWTDLTEVSLVFYLFEIKMTFTHLIYFCKKTEFCYNFMYFKRGQLLKEDKFQEGQMGELNIFSKEGITGRK